MVHSLNYAYNPTIQMNVDKREEILYNSEKVLQNLSSLCYLQLV